jgi:hypothetical protein
MLGSSQQALKWNKAWFVGILGFTSTFATILSTVEQSNTFLNVVGTIQDKWDVTKVYSTHTKWAYNTSTCMSYIVVVNNSLKKGHEFLFGAAPSCWVSRWYHRFLNITLHATTGIYTQHLELQQGVTLGKELSCNSFMDLEDKDTIAVVSYPWSKLCLG